MDVARRTESLQGRGGGFAGRAAGLVWLVFLGLPLYEMFDDPSVSGAHKAFTVAIVVAFITLFCLLIFLPEEGLGSRTPAAVMVILVLMWAVTVFLVFYDRPSWDYEFIFTVFPALRLFGGPIAAGTVVGALAVGVGLTAGLDYGDLVVVTLIILGSAISSTGVVRLISANEALRKARADEARVAVAEERLRFARDLHDLLGHSLSVISLKSEVATRVLPGDPDRAGQELAEIQLIARRALREVREAVTGYRQASLEVELAGARAALGAAGVRWQEQVATAELTGAVEAALAWTLREGVTNVVRHARATSCGLALVVQGDQAIVTVTDDGRGPTPATGGVVYGNGLTGLRERVAAVDGRLEVGPNPDGGFRLRVSVPVGEP